VAKIFGKGSRVFGSWAVPRPPLYPAESVRLLMNAVYEKPDEPESVTNAFTEVLDGITQKLRLAVSMTEFETPR
jgi:hypothetical protein